MEQDDQKLNSLSDALEEVQAEGQEVDRPETSKQVEAQLMGELERLRQRVQEHAQEKAELTSSPPNFSTLDEEAGEGRPEETEEENQLGVSGAASGPNAAFAKLVANQAKLTRQEEKLRAQELLKAEARQRLGEIEQKRLRYRSLWLFLGIFLILLVSMGLSSLIRQSFRIKPKLQFVQVGSLNENFEVKGIIGRDEKVFISPIEGIVRPLKPEGSRVGVNEKLVMLLSPQLQEVYRTWLEVAQKQAFRRLELMEAGKVSEAYRYYRGTEERMHDLLDELRLNSSQGSVRKNESARRSIDALLYERNLELGNLDFKDETVKEYDRRAQILEGQLQAQSVYTLSGQSGHISYRYDGQEQLITKAFLENISSVEFQNLYKQLGDYRAMSEHIREGDAVYRLVKGPTQYFALEVEGLAEDFFEEGHRLFSIYLPESDLTIETCVLMSHRFDNGKHFLLCRSDSAFERLLSTRVFSGRIAFAHRSGFKVPMTALTGFRQDEEGTIADFMLIRGGATKRVAVRVEGADEKEAIVSALNPEEAFVEGSVYVSNPDQVEEGVSLE